MARRGIWSKNEGRFGRRQNSLAGRMESDSTEVDRGNQQWQTHHRQRQLPDTCQFCGTVV